MDSEKYYPGQGQLIDLGFDELKEMEEALDSRSTFARQQLDANKDRDSVVAKVRELSRPWDDFEKHFDANLEQFGNRGNGETKSYSMETRTNITRNADGSIHKETVTTELLADGSSKTTKTVDITPAGGDTRQAKTETTITTTPSTETKPFDDHPNSFSASVSSNPSSLQTEQLDSRPQIEEKPTFERSVERDKSNEAGKDQTDWTWWYWSKK